VPDSFPSRPSGVPVLARLIVDLDALRANYQSLCRRVGGRAVAAVVKANAYGLGVQEVASALAAVGCRTFFVATVDEALELRSLLPRVVIYTLGGVPGAGAAEALTAADVRPVLNSLGEAEAWAAVAPDRPAALQLDTGLTRSGFDEREAAELLARPQLVAKLGLVLLLTHFACADEPGHPANERQRRVMDRLRQGFGDLPTSIANSAGTLLGPDFCGDIVRPGIALYGGQPLADGPYTTRPVVRLEARVLQRRVLDAPQTVGYGATVVAPAGTAIAVIAIGYADGWPRSLGNGAGRILVGDKAVPVLGRVSMDLTVVDVTGAAPGQPAVGEYVTLIGPGLALEDVAAAAGTIGYEILTGLGRRVRREYLGRR
jgi:alanine racemase